MFEFLIASSFFIKEPKLMLLEKKTTLVEQQIPQIPKTENLEEIIIPTTIPIQVPLENEQYSVFFNRASLQVSDKSADCAKFVNRMFLARFNALMFGSAWDLQLAKENKKYITLKWRLPESEFIRQKGDQFLAIATNEDRVRHFEILYDLLRQEENPIGVIGFVYRFSFHREEVSKHKEWLPQTHVTFLAGRKKFEIKNESDVAKNVETILGETHGKIHEFEKPFVDNIVALERILQPQESITYDDFLIEEHYHKVMSGSLLELFLRKHRNNRITPLLRPTSYSAISDEIREEIARQEKYLAKLGNLDFIKGSDFTETDSWKNLMKTYFSISNPQKSLLIPVPQKAISEISPTIAK